MKNNSDEANNLATNSMDQHSHDKEVSSIWRLRSPSCLKSLLLLGAHSTSRRTQQQIKVPPARASRSKILPISLLICCCLILPLIWVLQDSSHAYSPNSTKITLTASYAKSNTTATSRNSDIGVHRPSLAKSQTFEPYIPYTKVIGHVHIAKTAGTEINGELAAHFERVCGHKGYSYDSGNVNKRVKDALQSLGCANNTCLDKGALSKLRPGADRRGRIPNDIMDEIGYDDCDIISLERSATKWDQIAEEYPMELHIPCRDPLEHLMSQCNHRHIQFQCNVNNVSDLERQVKQCIVGGNRFGDNLIHNKNIELKCFNPIPIDPYLNIVGRVLQRKRNEATYIHRPTNTIRNKAEECIWSNTTVAEMVEKILLERVYYQWCQQCIGSQHDLLLLGSP